MDMVLATLPIDGQPRQVLMHAPKNGFFYVIDRATGKLISAEKIGKVTWAERIDLATGRPVENPEARYPNGEVLIWPGSGGVHNWPSMSFNPATGLMYIPTQDVPGYYNDKGIDTRLWRHEPGRMAPQSGANVINEPMPPLPDGTLLAWDPLKQKAAWRVTVPGLFPAGTLTTAGNLVFQGRADGRFVAYAADTGQELWSVQTGSGIVAAPITYRVGTRQYVSVITGQTGGMSLWNAGLFGWQSRTQSKRLYTFALDAKAPMPVSTLPAAAVPVDDPQFVVDPAKALRGKQTFAHCFTCHGPGAVAGGAAPDLRASPLVLDAKVFDAVVRGGLLQQRGMPRFEELSDDDLDVMRHYLRQRARESLAPPPSAPQTVSAVPARPGSTASR
jgi:quinohemoprotein ethanol dehydrogenase